MTAPADTALLHSWNVNGLRAAIRKGFDSYVARFAPDILCLQETKCPAETPLPDGTAAAFPHKIWHPAARPGYSGTAIFSKFAPLGVQFDFDGENHPPEGRVITLEFPRAFVVCAYVPNSQDGLARLDYRLRWDADFRAHLRRLAAKKTVLVCGDLNCAHERIDIARPDDNERNAGFTIEERNSLSETLAAGFADTFREKNPSLAGAYSWWSYRGGARARNIGWRLDYWLVSRDAAEKFSAPAIHADVPGSDHCPVSVRVPVCFFA